MKNCIIVLISSIILCSCSSTVHLKSASEAVPKLKNRDAVIHFKSGQALNCRQISLEKDHLICTSLENGSLLKVPNEDIESINVKHGLGGTLEGLFIGGTAGAGIGYLATAGIKGSEAGLFRGIVIVTGGAIGGLTGIVVGCIRGHRYTLILPQDSLATAR